MNYKVMKRPMFKLGGKAASQGTGITSGMDEKVNLAIGGGVIQGQNMGAREGFQDPDYSSMSVKDLMDLRAQNVNKQMSGLDSMRDIIRLQTIGNLAGNVLPNIESGGFSAVTDFFKDPMTTQAAITGLTGLKKVDLKEKELERSKLDNILGDKINLKKLEQGDRQLDIAEKKALVESATALRNRLTEEARKLLDEYKSVENMPPDIKQQYYDNRKIGVGDLTPSDARKLAIVQVKQDEAAMNKAREEQGLSPKYFTQDELKQKVDILVGVYLESFSTGNAMGGTPNRVERQMGSPMMGEQPMAQAPQMMAPQQDVAMETQKDSGNKVYAMLRSRLPQEVPDEVVQLISYNKEAFADFASIKNQEDVTSFNEKYGVELVIDVATV